MRLVEKLDWKGLNPLKRRLSAYCAVNALHLVYTKKSQLILCKMKVVVRSEIHTKHILHCEHYVEFCNVKKLSGKISNH
jgi:hypothetical protein